MDFLRLKYFLALAEHLNYTEAAMHLFITQPTLSRQIKSLEEEIGMQLFVRTKKFVSLTSAGEMFLKEAKVIVKHIDELNRKMNQFKSGSIGDLIIGYNTMAMHYFLSDMLKIFTKKGINISLIKATQRELNELLMEKKVDIILIPDVGLIKSVGTKWMTVKENKLNCLVSSEHRLANRGSIKLNELNGESSIMAQRYMVPVLQEAIFNMCQRRGVTFKAEYYEKDPETMFLRIESGKGISLMSSLFKEIVNRNIRFLDIEDCDVNMDLVMAWNQNNNNPSLSLFLEFLSEVKV